MINYGDYICPVLIGKNNGSEIKIDRYAGVAFFIGGQGLVATCKHIVEMKNKDEILLAKNLNENEFEILDNIRVHPTKDFAIAYLPKRTQYKIFSLNANEFLVGHDVQAFGFTYNNTTNGIIQVDARLRKGYIVRKSDTSINSDSGSLLEVSFPSEKGFSGTPLISTADYSVVGMLYGNAESSIIQHIHTEVVDGNEKFIEKVNKIVEFGLAHSNQDIEEYLSDLNIQRFP